MLKQLEGSILLWSAIMVCLKLAPYSISDGAVQLDQHTSPYLCLAKFTLSLWFIRLSLVMKDASFGCVLISSRCLAAAPLNVA